MRKFEKLTGKALLGRFEKASKEASDYDSEPEGLCGKFSPDSPSHPVNKAEELREEILYRLNISDSFLKGMREMKDHFDRLEKEMY